MVWHQLRDLVCFFFCCLASVIQSYNSLNNFSGATGPIFVKFHMEPPWVGEMKVCSNGHNPSNKIATMPIFDKTKKTNKKKKQKKTNIKT